MAAALWVDQRWVHERALREAEQAAIRHARDEAQRVAHRPHVPTPDEVRLHNLAPLLRQPWLPTLRLIENVTEPPVYLLRVSIDPSTGSVRIEGEVPSFDQALNYVQSLDEDGLLGPARLLSHETVNDASGRSVVRFAVHTAWNKP